MNTQQCQAVTTHLQWDFSSFLRKITRGITVTWSYMSHTALVGSSFSGRPRSLNRHCNFFSSVLESAVLLSAEVLTLLAPRAVPVSASSRPLCNAGLPSSDTGGSGMTVSPAAAAAELAPVALSCALLYRVISTSCYILFMLTGRST